MNFCPKIKAALVIFALSFSLSSFSASAEAYSEAQRASDFYKHQNYKKQLEKKRLAAAKEQSRKRRSLERSQEKSRKQFIANGRNKKLDTSRYENQYLKAIAKKQREYKALIKNYVYRRNQKRKKRSRSQIGENTEFGINTSLDDSKYY